MTVGLLSLAALFTQSGQTWQPIKIGTGGFIPDISISNSAGADAFDTMVSRTDVYGAYLWNASATTPVGNAGGTGAWQQLFNTTSMPNDLVANGMLYGFGCFGLEVSPSNATVMYMTGRCYPPGVTAGNPPKNTIYKSTNKGTSWVKTSFTPVDQSLMDMDGSREWGGRMAIKPDDPNTVIIGLNGTGGCQITLDGGTTWTACGNLPTATGNQGVTGLIFHPVTTTTAWASVAGHGIYKSTNVNLGSSSTWSLMTGGAASSWKNAVTSTGTLYVVETQGGDFYQLKGTTWTTIFTSSGVVAVACDPFNSNHTICCNDSGAVSETLNDSTFSNPFSGFDTTFTDIPWIGDIANPGGAAINAICLKFSPTTQNLVYSSGENFFWKMTISGAITSGTTIHWSSMGVGNEEIVANCMATRVTGKPVLGGWDHAVFAPDLVNYPSHCFLRNGLLSACWSIDQAPFTNTGFLACIADGNPYGGTFGRQFSSFSTDNGVTWSQFGSGSTTLPSGVWSQAGGGSGNAGGCMAVSTPSNMIWAPGGGVQPFFTLDGGVTWTHIDLSGNTPPITNWSTFGGGPQNGNISVVADPNTINAFWLYKADTGIYYTTNGGTSWVFKGTASGTSLTYFYAVPGQSGHLWGAQGPTGTAGNCFPAASFSQSGGNFFYSTDFGATWTFISNLNCAGGGLIAFTAPAPTKSYPAVYFAGFSLYASTTSITFSAQTTQNITVPTGSTSIFTVGTPICVQANGGGGAIVTGRVSAPFGTNGTNVLTMSVDNINTTGSGSSWIVAAYGVWENDNGPSSSPAVTQIGPWMNNSLDVIKCFAGDPGVYGQLYVGFAGSGWAMRK